MSVERGRTREPSLYPKDEGSKGPSSNSCQVAQRSGGVIVVGMSGSVAGVAGLAGTTSPLPFRRPGGNVGLCEPFSYFVAAWPYSRRE